FIFSMSLFFFMMTLVQIPAQIVLGILNWERVAYGAAAVVPLLLGMFLGGVLGKKLPKSAFDMAIIAILTLLALRLLASNFFA
ncbi:MAG: sulfite exporter TauE/SafE family protein, partial [Boseongicola sp.]|nr:sulfite exporter TauE/SafE family protein [Boseongicola sp.]